jgi:hypothetical protein
VGLLLTLLVQTPLRASPDLQPSARMGNVDLRSVDLRLDGATAGRLLAQSQESDNEKPKPEEKPDDMKVTVTKGGADSSKKAAAPAASEDSFAFLKDWPFWVITGGVIIVGVATYMIVRNSNEKHSCPTLDDAGCYGAGKP